nr:immunoglobulin heavy chain junction region [Macaca mulatta]
CARKPFGFGLDSW